ncbi:unnamed protein product, partial [Amoebophrya sp. A25]
EGCAAVAYLESAGARVIRSSVDATEVNDLTKIQTLPISGRDVVVIEKFKNKETSKSNSNFVLDYVVFNFPHTGTNQTAGGIAQLRRSIADNRALLRGLFSALRHIITRHTKV